MSALAVVPGILSGLRPQGIKKTVVFLILAVILFFPVKNAFEKQLEKLPDALNTIGESLKKMKVFGENKAIIQYAVYPIDPNPKIIIGTL